MNSAYDIAPCTTPTRHSERVSYDRAAVLAVLDEALICHVGFLVDGGPVVLPQLYARIEDELILHGSTGSRMSRLARNGGLRVCITVTLTDGLVLARSAFNHSINFRSVVVHGVAREVIDHTEKQAALAWLVNAVVAGRSDDVRQPSMKELNATTVLRVPLVDVSLKVRTGPPSDEAADLMLPCWAGVLPLRNSVPGDPQPAPNLAPSIPVPVSINNWPRL